MNVKTKYNVNDELWFIIGKAIVCKKVTKIVVHVQGSMIKIPDQKRGFTETGNYFVDKTYVEYIMEGSLRGSFYTEPIEEKYLFKTKSALIKSL